MQDTRVSNTSVNIRMVNDNSKELVKEIVNEKLTVSVDTESVVKTVDIVTSNPIVSKIVGELTNDPKFLARVDESVKKMLADGKLDSTDIPEIVYLIMDAYNTIGSVTVSKEDLGIFVKLLFTFLVYYKYYHCFHLSYYFRYLSYSKYFETTIKSSNIIIFCFIPIF